MRCTLPVSGCTNVGLFSPASPSAGLFFYIPFIPPAFLSLSPQVSVAIGCAVRDRNVVFASTFATFFTRAYDQLRMAAISESNINLCGSHCGVSIGQFLTQVMTLKK